MNPWAPVLTHCAVAGHRQLAERLHVLPPRLCRHVLPAAVLRSLPASRLLLFPLLPVLLLSELLLSLPLRRRCLQLRGVHPQCCHLPVQL